MWVYFAFLLGSLALFAQGTLLARLSILAFAPFLALVVLRCPPNQSVWWAVAAGCLVDLFSDDPMGLHALNYAVTVALLLRIRKQFSHEQPLHVSLVTGLFSVGSTLLQLFLLFLFDRRVPFDGKWILADLVGMPLIDALYAFVWFTAPLSLFDKLHRLWVLFWLKRKNPSPTSP